MQKFYDWLASAYFIAATIILMLLALLLLISAVWEIVAALTSPDLIEVALNSIGLLIIGFAVVETAKFIAEEEILRRRELRSPMESRRSLTKFITIIVIAASLEALVMTFEAGRTDVEDAIYPAALFIASMFALISLGAYQWLSSRIGSSSAREQHTHEVQ